MNIGAYDHLSPLARRGPAREPAVATSGEATPPRVETPRLDVASDPDTDVAVLVEDPEAAQAAEEASPARLQDAVEAARKRVADQGLTLDFDVLEENGQLQVAVHDKSSGKLLRKIPSDEMVRLSQSLHPRGQGPSGMLDRQL